ncbi:hypothetical protein D3C81_2293320 [compost metagenome]
MPFGLALPGLELDLLQIDFAQIAAERAVQGEGAGWAIQRRGEAAEVFAIGVGDVAI